MTVLSEDVAVKIEAQLRNKWNVFCDANLWRIHVFGKLRACYCSTRLWGRFGIGLFIWHRCWSCCEKLHHVPCHMTPSLFFFFFFQNPGRPGYKHTWSKRTERRRNAADAADRARHRTVCPWMGSNPTPWTALYSTQIAARQSGNQQRSLKKAKIIKTNRADGAQQCVHRCSFPFLKLLTPSPPPPALYKLFSSFSLVFCTRCCLVRDLSSCLQSSLRGSH